jgi:hypothetical protein
VRGLPRPVLPGAILAIAVTYEALFLEGTPVPGESSRGTSLRVNADAVARATSTSLGADRPGC